MVECRKNIEVTPYPVQNLMLSRCNTFIKVRPFISPPHGEIGSLGAIRLRIYIQHMEVQAEFWTTATALKAVEDLGPLGVRNRLLPQLTELQNCGIVQYENLHSMFSRKITK